MADLFNNITFDEETHTYQYNNKRADISVTGLIHQYSQEFDEEAMAERVANKNQKQIADVFRYESNPSEDMMKWLDSLLTNKEDILDEWHTRRDYSCLKGNEIHKFAQGLWKHEEHNTDYATIETHFVEQLKADLEILKPQAIAFYNEYNEMLELVKDEQYIYDEDYDIAGSIDLLCRNKYTNEYVIVDFKSNDNFYKKAYGNMKVPLHELEDSNLSHYSLQLEIYKQIFEKNTKEKVECTFIVYFNLEADNYTIIEPLNVKKEVKKILEDRRKDKMKIVIVMGNSGTGKTFSFRNLPAEHSAIISVAKTDLPFKNRNNIKFVQCEDYEAIKKALTSSKKQILIVDDASFLTQFEMLKRATQGSEYGKKENGIAKNFYELLRISREFNEDDEKILYITMHERKNDCGLIAPRTCGNSVDDRINVEGQVNVLLRSLNKDGQYVFQTKNGGDSVCKTPDEMFSEEFIPNDLWEVDKTIRKFYGFKPITEKLEDKKEEDK